MANILLVEDNQGLGNLAAGLLSPNGHVVKHVLSAEAAAESRLSIIYGVINRLGKIKLNSTSEVA